MKEQKFQNPIVLATLMVTLLGVIGTWLVVPEFRRFSGLEPSKQSVSDEPPNNTTTTSASNEIENGAPESSDTEVNLTRTSNEKVSYSEVPDNNIKKLDLNNFIHTVGGFCDEGNFLFVNGIYLEHSQDGSIVCDCEITQTVEGDLTGDGVHEKVIVIRSSGGGSGWSNEGLIYTLFNGRPTLLTKIEGGGRDGSAIEKVSIQEGLLKVKHYDAENRYYWDGEKLQQIGIKSLDCGF